MSLAEFCDNAVPTITLPERRPLQELQERTPGRHASWRHACSLPEAVEQWLLAGCVLLVGITSALNPAAAQQLSADKVRLAKLGLPPIESLTFESDYTVFMAPGVPSDIRCKALRKLWSFPFFRESDGLGTYAGNYTADQDTPEKQVVHALATQQSSRAIRQ